MTPGNDAHRQLRPTRAAPIPTLYGSPPPLLQSLDMPLVLGSKPKKFDFVQRTFSRREALADGARD